MAREYGKVLFGMFTDDDFTAQYAVDKLLYLALVGQPSFNHAGVAYVNFRRLSKALRDGDHEPTRHELVQSFARLELARYVYLDIDTGEVLIRSFMRSDGVARKPNVLVSALRSCLQVESKKLAAVLRSEVARIELPEVTGEGPQAKRLRVAVPELRDEVLATLPEWDEAQVIDYIDGEPETPRGPSAGGSSRGSAGPSAGGSAPPGEIGPSAGPSAGGSPRPPVVVAVAVEPSVTENSSGERAREATADKPEAVPGPADAPKCKLCGRSMWTNASGEVHLSGYCHVCRKEPDRHCPRHPDGTDEPCNDCRSRRMAHEAWEARVTEARTLDADALRRQAAATRRAERETIAATKRAAIDNCPDCNTDGYRGALVCDHDPDTDNRRTRGMAKIRAALEKDPNHTPTETSKSPDEPPAPDAEA